MLRGQLRDSTEFVFYRIIIWRCFYKTILIKFGKYISYYHEKQQKIIFLQTRIYNVKRADSERCQYFIRYKFGLLV